MLYNSGGSKNIQEEYSFIKSQVTGGSNMYFIWRWIYLLHVAAQPHIVKEADHDVNTEAVTPSSETPKSPGFDNHNGSSKHADVAVDERQEVVEPEEEAEEIVPSPERNNTEVEEIETRKIEHEAAEIVESVQHSNQNEVDEVTEEVVNGNFYKPISV